MKRFAVLLFFFAATAFAGAPPRPTVVQFTQPGTPGVVRSLPVPAAAYSDKRQIVVSDTLANDECTFRLGGQWVRFDPPCNTITRDWIYPEAPPPPPPPSPDCVAGSGHDYQVGTGAGQLAATDVPWENLQPGDSVRFFYKGSAYKTKFAINSHGTVANPVRVCGVTGPNGELVDIDGADAVSRRTMDYGRTSASSTNQARGVVWVGPKGVETDVNPPGAVVLGPGLYIHNAHPSKRFTDTNGAQQSYLEFGAAIVCDPCHDLTIVGNTIADSSQAVWTRSQDGGDARHSTNTIIRGNRFSGTGIAGDDHEHTLYIQSYTPTVEYNWFGPMVAGTGGNALKDRSVMPIVRYNKFESGTFAMDFVEAEDYAVDATSDPRYYTTYAYGNIISKGNVWAVHYGGNNGGTETYRKGHLYFWNNTLNMAGDPGEGFVVMFRISTLDETVDAWNNSFYCARGDSNYYCALRAHDDSTDGGGTLNLGVNWMTHGCGVVPSSVCDGTDGHPPGGTLNGVENLVVGLQPPPFSTTTFFPLGAAMSAGQAQPAAVAAYPVTQQIDPSAVPRQRATTRNLGAVEGT